MIYKLQKSQHMIKNIKNAQNEIFLSYLRIQSYSLYKSAQFSFIEIFSKINILKLLIVQSVHYILYVYVTLCN